MMSTADISPENVPIQLKYSGALRPQSVPGRMVRRQFLPEGGNSYNTANRTIRIPVFSTSGFLDTRRSFLRFDVTVTSGAAANAVLMNSAYSLFDRLDVLNGSGAVLETIGDYGNLVNGLADFAMDRSSRTSAGSDMGFAKAAGITAAVGGAASATHYNLNTMTSFAGGAATTTKTFCIPLAASGVFTMSSKAHGPSGEGYLTPLPLISRLYIQLTLKDAIAKILFGLGADAPTALTVSNINYDAALVEFDQSFIQAMKQGLLASGGRAFISSQSWLSQRFSGNSTVYQPQFNVRSRSLKSVITLVKIPAQDSATWGSDVPDGCLGGVQQYYLTINNNNYPAPRVVGSAQALAEAQNAMGKSAMGITHLGHYDLAAAADVTYTDAKDIPTAVYGADLENLIPGADYKESGLSNETGGPISVYAQFAAAIDRTLINYVHTDIVLELDANVGEMNVSY
jgi:hypothetical protein